MKVLMVNTINLEKNGITTFILNSCESLKEQNVDVDIAASNVLSKDIKNKLKKNSISYIKLPDRKVSIVTYFLSLIKLLKKKNYDVVHVNGNSATMAIELCAAKIANIKVRVAHSHNTTTEHPLANKILRPIFDIAVNARIACNTAAGRWMFGEEKFLVIKNGILLKNYVFESDKRECIRDQLNLNSKDVLLGHVGFFNYQKNQDFFINLMKGINKKYKLLLIGEGALLKDFKEKVKASKLESRIITIGAVSNVYDYLNAMDVFLLPSKFEGQPFVIIEALADGLPCIISDKVSKEIDITRNSFFRPLITSNWVEAIEELQPQNRVLTNKNNQKLLKANGYDASENGVILKRYYQSCLDGGR